MSIELEECDVDEFVSLGARFFIDSEEVSADELRRVLFGSRASMPSEQIGQPEAGAE